MVSNNIGQTYSSVITDQTLVKYSFVLCHHSSLILLDFFSIEKSHDHLSVSLFNRLII